MNSYQMLQEYAAEMKELSSQAELAAVDHRWVELLALGQRVNALVCKTVMRLMETPPPSESGKIDYGMAIDQPASISTYMAMKAQLVEVDNLLAAERAKAAKPVSDKPAEEPAGAGGGI